MVVFWCDSIETNLLLMAFSGLTVGWSDAFLWLYQGSMGENVYVSDSNLGVCIVNNCEIVHGESLLVLC